MTATLDIAAIVAAADRVPGWMSLTELRWLAEQASSRRKILEVGSYEGRSTKALAMATPGVVYACDDWRGEADRPTAARDLRQRFITHLNAELHRGKVIMCEMSSAQLLANYRSKPHLLGAAFDLVILDGSHDADSVRADITGWLPYLESGGLLAGHDYWLPGVAAALDAVLPNAKVVAGSIWAWSAPL